MLIDALAASELEPGSLRFSPVWSDSASNRRYSRSYLSPNVSIAESLEHATKVGGATFWCFLIFLMQRSGNQQLWERLQTFTFRSELQYHVLMFSCTAWNTTGLSRIRLRLFLGRRSVNQVYSVNMLVSQDCVTLCSKAFSDFTSRTCWKSFRHGATGFIYQIRMVSLRDSMLPWWFRLLVSSCKILQWSQRYQRPFAQLFCQLKAFTVDTHRY